MIRLACHKFVSQYVRYKTHVQPTLFVELSSTDLSAFVRWDGLEIHKLDVTNVSYAIII